MIELYFSIRTVLLIVGLILMAVYIVYKLWKWLH